MGETKTSSSMISSSSSMTASSTSNVMQNSSSNVNVSGDKCFAQVPPKSPGPSSRKFPSSSSTSSAAPKGKSVNSRPPPPPTPTSLENSKTEPMLSSTSSGPIPM